MEILHNLPEDAQGVLVSLSGGLDSTTSLRLAVAKYGADRVAAASFDYGQKQRIELDRARAACQYLGVRHRIIDTSFIYHINQGFSANLDSSIQMPTLEEVLGDPQPKTYVANRNMILFSITASIAEVEGCNYILCGLQANDTYGYWDTTPVWVEKMNAVLAENRNAKIKIIAPFNMLNKKEEIEAVLALDGNLDLYRHTLTCYNPDEEGKSCGVCPSCRERLAAFKKLGLTDPVPYQEK